MAFDATFSPYCHASFDFPSGNEFSTRAWCVPTADLSAHDRRRDEASSTLGYAVAKMVGLTIRGKPSIRSVFWPRSKCGV